MKKIIILALLMCNLIFAQDFFVSKVNSSTTGLDSAATFTGTGENVEQYGSISIIARSDKASATSGWKFQFSTNGTTWDNFYFKTYAANDTLTNVVTIPVRAKYFRVVFTNTTSDQTYFRLQTIFHKAVLPTNDGSSVVGLTQAVIDSLQTPASGGATATRQDTLLAVQKNIRSWLAAIMTYTDALEAAADSSLNVVKNNRTHLADIKNILDTDSLTVKDIINLKNLLTQIGNTLTSDSLSVVDIVNIKNLLTQLGIKVDSTDASLTRIEGDQTLLLGYSHPSNVDWAGNTLTVSTEVDSISITATTWYNFKVFSVDDTVEVALDLAFTNPRIAYPYTAIDKYLNISPVTYPKIYIRRKGAGTATYNYSGEGY